MVNVEREKSDDNRTRISAIRLHHLVFRNSLHKLSVASASSRVSPAISAPKSCISISLGKPKQNISFVLYCHPVMSNFVASPADATSIATIRTLAADVVGKANSGHPGTVSVISSTQIEVFITFRSPRCSDGHGPCHPCSFHPVSLSSLCSGPSLIGRFGQIFQCQPKELKVA